MRFKRVILFLCAGLFALLVFAPRLAGPRLLERAQQTAAERGVRFEVEEPHYGWTALSGRALRLSIVRRMFFARLEFTNFAAHASLRGIAKRTLPILFDAKFLDGSLHASAFMQRDRFGLDLALEGAQLASQPELRLAGITSGLLSLTIRKAVFSPEGPLEGTFELSVNSLSRARSMLLKSLEESLSLPDVKDGSLHFLLTPRRQGEWQADIQGKSNLFDLTASGTVAIRGIDLAGRALFSPEGEPLKKRLLRAAGDHGSVPSARAQVAFTVSGTAARPVLKVTGE